MKKKFYISKTISISVGGHKINGYDFDPDISIPPPLDETRLGVCEHIDRDKMTDKEICDAYFNAERANGEKIQLLLCPECRPGLK